MPNGDLSIARDGNFLKNTASEVRFFKALGGGFGFEATLSDGSVIGDGIEQETAHGNDVPETAEPEIESSQASLGLAADVASFLAGSRR